jgi:hypothetical protein
MTVNDVVILPVNDAILTKTAANAVKKYRYIYSTLMYNRSPVELLDNIFMGDLAKNALLEYLKPLCSQPLIDYDEIRTDNFLEPDPGWDFKAGIKQIKAEVKSSIPTNSESHQAIINKRDIKITASHDKGKTWIQPEALESELHVQVYFYAKPDKDGYEQFDTLYEDVTADSTAIHRIINTKKYSQPLFFGWNRKSDIISFVKTKRPNTWSFDKTSRVYWVCPVKGAFTMPQLVRYINNNQDNANA